MTRKIKCTTLLTLWLGLASATEALWGEGLKIIVNPSVDLSEISAAELRSIFLGTSASVKSAGTVKPVLGRESMQRFASSYLGKSGSALETYYRSLVFTGRWSMPPNLPSDADVVKYVSSTPGAIGFVRESTRSDPAKTVRVK